MRRAICLSLTLLFCTTCFAAEVSDDAFGMTILSARTALMATPVNVSTCHAIADDLASGIARNPQSEDIPVALLLYAQCIDACGNPKLAIDIATQIIERYPTSPAAENAYNFAWQRLTNSGQDPVAGFGLIRMMAETLGSDPRASRYWLDCFEAHANAQQWNDALVVGQHCLQLSKKSPNSVLQLQVAEVADKAGETKIAVELLDRICKAKPPTPECILAHCKLSTIAEKNNDLTSANLHDERAWNIYANNIRKPGFNSANVAQAAAQAGWALQKSKYHHFDSLIRTADCDEKDCRKSLTELEALCTQVMTADQELAPAALNRIGDCHGQFAEALLRKTRTQDQSSSVTPPCERALPEFNAAVTAYARAFQQANGHDEHQPEATYAATHCFDLTARQGELMLAWAEELYGHAPIAQTGADARRQRVDYLIKIVVPAFSRGLGFRIQAVNLAPAMPVADAASKLGATLDLPLRDTATDLASIAHDYSQRLRAEAVELKSMSTMSFDETATRTLEAKIEDNYEQMSDALTEIRRGLDSWISVVPTAMLSPDSRVVWQQQKITNYSESAEALRTLQDALAACRVRFEQSSDLDIAFFRNKMAKLQARAVSDEYHTLIEWEQYVSSANIHHPLNDQLYARLAEVDPVHFGAIPNSRSSTRRNP